MAPVVTTIIYASIHSLTSSSLAANIVRYVTCVTDTSPVEVFAARIKISDQQNVFPFEALNCLIFGCSKVKLQLCILDRGVQRSPSSTDQLLKKGL